MNNQDRKGNQKFFITVLIIGVVVLVILIVNMLNDNDTSSVVYREKTKTTTEVVGLKTKNRGRSSSFNNVSDLEDFTLATFYDKNSSKYTDVDVRVLSISDDEIDLTVPEGFIKKKVLYEVYFNDLDYLKDAIYADIEVKVYTDLKNDFVTINEQNYILSTNKVNIGNKINNNDNSQLENTFIIPINHKDYRLCLGNSKYSQACYKID